MLYVGLGSVLGTGWAEVALFVAAFLVGDLITVVALWWRRRRGAVARG